MKRMMTIAVAFATASTVALAGGGFGLYGILADMNDFDNTGYGGGLKLQADLAEETLGFELRIQGLTGYGEDETEDSYLASAEANLTLGAKLADSLKVYVGAGGGYYVFPEFDGKAPIYAFPDEVPIGNILEIDPDDVWGFFAVAGLELMLSESFGLFAEAKYLVAEVDTAKIDDVEVDIEDGDFGGFGANAGILFRF